MTETEYKRKLKRLEWLVDRAERLNTKVFDDDIEQLAEEIEEYEREPWQDEPIDPRGVLQFHLDRTGIEQAELAKILGITQGYLSNLLTGCKRITPKMSYKIENIDFYKAIL